MELTIEGLGFSKEEIKKRKELKSLFDAWLKRMLGAGMPADWEESFVPDGFYPGYLAQKYRILFIGRESLGLTGCDYIETLFSAYHKKTIGRTPLNRSRFHALQMYVAYGLMNGVRDYHAIPWATEIAETFGKPNGLSYAFMNLSKLSNDDESWMADWGLINESIKFSKGSKNLYNREIDILAPDLVVTMNLGGHLHDLGEIAFVNVGNDDVAVYELLVGDAKIPVFDTWHFAAPGKSPEAQIFSPLMTAIDSYMKAHKGFRASPPVSQKTAHSTRKI